MTDSDFDYRKVFSGKSVSIVFKDVGDVSFEGADTGSVAVMGKTAHAHIVDDQTSKIGHMFMVFTGSEDDIAMPPVVGADSPVGAFEAIPVDQDLVYVDSVALQLLESAETHRTDEHAKALIFDEINETLAMDYS